MDKIGLIDLPPELQEEIYMRLVRSDQIRFASTCKEYYASLSFASANPPMADPWLIFTGEDYGREVNRKNDSLCLSDKRFYRFDKIIPKENHQILGSSNGWLITIRPHPISYMEYYIIVHPILNAQIVLKRRRILSLPNTECFKTILQVNQTLEETTLVLLSKQSGYLHFIRRHKCILVKGCIDVVFHGGKYYALYKREEGTYSIRVKSCNFDNREFLAVEGIVRKSTKDRAYLIPECGEDVLIMLIRADYDGHGEGGSLKDMLLAGCEIYKLLMTDGGSTKALRLQSLGGHALFFDGGGCKSLPVGRFSLFEEDHIYFTPILDKCSDITSHEYGVYSLKDESIKQFPNIPSSIPPQESYWYFPTKKGCVC